MGRIILKAYYLTRHCAEMFYGHFRFNSHMSPLMIPILQIRRLRWRGSVVHLKQGWKVGQTLP